MQCCFLKQGVGIVLFYAVYPKENSFCDIDTPLPLAYRLAIEPFVIVV